MDRATLYHHYFGFYAHKKSKVSYEKNIDSQNHFNRNAKYPAMQALQNLSLYSFLDDDESLENIDESVTDADGDESSENIDESGAEDAESETSESDNEDPEKSPPIFLKQFHEQFKFKMVRKKTKTCSDDDG